jgi:hypothetical protein
VIPFAADMLSSEVSRSLFRPFFLHLVKTTTQFNDDIQTLDSSVNKRVSGAIALFDSIGLELMIIA